MGTSTRRSFVRTTGLTALAVGASRTLSGIAFAQSPADTSARVVIDARRTVATIDRRLFGSFLEHLGRAIYGGVFEPGSTLADQNGFRRDVLDEIRKLQVPIVRYPGGNFVSGYDWLDGVGPRSVRPSVLDRAWNSIETTRLVRQTTYYPYAWALAHAKGQVLDLSTDVQAYDAAPVGKVPYVDVAGTIDPASGATTLFALNRDLDKARTLKVTWRDGAPARVVGAEVLTGRDLKATNTLDAPSKVVPQALPTPGLTDRPGLAVPGPWALVLGPSLVRSPSLVRGPRHKWEWRRHLSATRHAA